MLKMQQPDLFRRRAGGVLLAVLAIGVAGAVYASTPSPQANVGGGISDRYTLKIDVAMAGHSDSMHFIRCLKPGEYAELSGTDASKLSWQGRFAVSPEASGQLEISAEVDTRFDRGGGNVRTQSAKPIVRTMPGQQASIVFGQVVDGGPQQSGKLEDNTINIALTPSMGCDGESLSSAAAQPGTISLKLKNVSARAAAEYVAAKVGFVLVDPEVLDERQMTFDYAEISAEAALHMIGMIEGKQAVIEGKQVRFMDK